ncbi:hypothetical protein GCM10011504_22350 [Siccirubricoccus deserti]|uniref:Uncharacterized protein n=1 Tax=Siccirubricoccus deserti TaxID=2013562 RepID=A0A9X0QXE8_9PROT|nr:hypothetical protein [Siccirubricoccus deserti]MBC4015650.1 hypothetical protein [Siccirubricoccus deserti]GGC43455.1 hypothetical protein GCM10011504_22350 [Siccirubricoccus deserti]
MSANASLWQNFGRPGPVRDIDRVPSCLPESYRLEATAPLTRTISATHALARRHMRMIDARRATACLMHGAPAVVAALRNREQGRTRPDTAARSLFRVIAREPAAVERALAAE